MNDFIDNKIEFWKYDKKPLYYISILISSYDTKIKYIHECLKSIEEQLGNFGVELVWIDDGSYELNSKMLTKILEYLLMDDEELGKQTGFTYPQDYRINIMKSISERC